MSDPMENLKMRSAQDLADTVKSLHRRLRQQFHQTKDANAVWDLHCRDNEALKEYAECMQKLATEHWQVLSAASPVTCRINWTRETLNYYYHNGGLEHQRRKCLPPCEWPNVDIKKIKVLDVGSCHNPLGEFGELDVFAIDLYPAKPSVLQCDFLRLPVDDVIGNSIADGRVESLACSQFHAVVFSFLLEYFPSPDQRWSCCVKAYQLLVPEGLFILITPDSKAAHSNYQMINSWRDALAAIGLRRIKYDKLKHAHCMAFRKTCLSSDKGEFIDHQQLASKMYIPQDFHEEPEETIPRPIPLRLADEEIASGFSELACMSDGDE